MIRTHKPRGHAWTNASVFQQTKEYRDISLENCRPAEAEVLAPDSDDELNEHQREAKRRRIERLADEFLNGAPLAIPSARPVPAAIKRTIARHNGIAGEPVSEVGAAVLSRDSGKAWDVAEDDFEILHRLKREREEKIVPQETSKRSSVFQTETKIENRAQSACKPKKSRFTPKLSTGSSIEASNQARFVEKGRLRQATPTDDSATLCDHPFKRTCSSSRKIHHDSLFPATGATEETQPGHGASFHTACDNIELPKAILPQSEHALAEGHTYDYGQYQDNDGLSGASDDRRSSNGNAKLCTARERNTPPTHDSAGEVDKSDVSASLVGCNPGLDWEIAHKSASDSVNSGLVPNPVCDPPYKTVLTKSATAAPLQHHLKAARLGMEDIKPQEHESLPRQSAVPIQRSSAESWKKPQRESEMTKEAMIIEHDALSETGKGNQEAPASSLSRVAANEELNGEPRSSSAHITLHMDEPRSFPSKGARKDAEVDKDRSNTTLHDEFLPRSRDSDSLLWSGTKAALDQAQTEPFNSPKEAPSSPRHAEKQRHSRRNGTPGSKGPTQAHPTCPQAQSPQQPSPNTQQLINDLPGWSTIRKPRSEPSLSLDATPPASKDRGTNARSDQLPAPFSSSQHSPTKQRQNLSSAGVMPQDPAESTDAPPSLPQRPRCAEQDLPRETTPVAPPPSALNDSIFASQPSLLHTAVTDLDRTAAVIRGKSQSTNSQRRSAGLESDLSQTIDELTNTVLETSQDFPMRAR